MAPGGDHVVSPIARALSHIIAKLLLAGKITKPADVLAAKWYYMTYHMANCDKLIVSRKKLPDETV